MEQIQLLLEQELGRIIVAIIILILLLIVIIIVANVSNKAKKAKLENTRTLHKDEFEKAAKKRMELTQTISRRDIANEIASKNSGKKDKVSDKTMELNLESIRKKQIKDERERIAEKVNERPKKPKKAASRRAKEVEKENDLTPKQEVLKPEVAKKKEVAPIVESVKNDFDEKLVVDAKSIDTPKVNEIKESVSPVADSKSSVDLNNVAKARTLSAQKPEEVVSTEKAVQEDVVDLFNEIDSTPVTSTVKEDNFDIFATDVESTNKSVENDNISKLSNNDSEISSYDDIVFGSIDEVKDDVADSDIIGNDFEKSDDEFKVVESFDIISNIEPINDNIIKEENLEIDLIEPEVLDEVEEVELIDLDEIDTVEPEEIDVVVPEAIAAVDAETIVPVPVVIDVWDDMFGENESAMSFDDDEIENQSTEMFLSIDKIVSSVEEEIVEEEPSIEFVDVEDQSVYKNNFVFGTEYFKSVESEEDLGKIAFDFNISAFEEFETEIENVENGFLFGDSIQETEIKDIIDVTMNKAIVSDELEIIAHTPVVEDVVIEDIVEEDEIEEDNTLDEIILSSVENQDALVTETMDDSEAYVVDIQSQLDVLDKYETDLLDDYDYSDDNYNYNFNSINVMEEIVEGMLLDDFVDDSEDEYFKYIYQFALLDDAIMPNKLNVEVEEEDIASAIVDKSKIKSSYEELVEKLETNNNEEEEKFELIEEEDAPVEFNNTFVNFTLDSELLDLTNRVIEHPRLVEENENNSTAYKSDQTRSVVSPVHGSTDAEEDTIEYFEDDITSLEVEEVSPEIIEDVEIEIPETIVEEIEIPETIVEEIEIPKVIEKEIEIPDVTEVVEVEIEVPEVSEEIEITEVSEEIEVPEVTVEEISEDDISETSYFDGVELISDLVDSEKEVFELESVSIDEDDDAISTFIDMINDKIEDTEEEQPESSEEFLDVLKGLIK